MPRQAIWVLPIKLTDTHLIVRVQCRVKMDARTFDRQLHAVHHMEQNKFETYFHKHPRDTDYCNEIEHDESGVILRYCLSDSSSRRAEQVYKMTDRRAFVMTIIWEDCVALGYIGRLLDSLPSISPRARAARGIGRTGGTGYTARRKPMTACTIPKTHMPFKKTGWQKGWRSVLD